MLQNNIAIWTVKTYFELFCYIFALSVIYCMYIAIRTEEQAKAQNLNCLSYKEL